jgi:UDP:flavonoid glycosyltransferase YjiC (YdhE family)
MRVMVTTTPGTGHVHPVVPLARAVRDQGHEVIWCTGPSACPAVERLGFASRPAGLPIDERQQRFFAAHPEVHTLPPPMRRPLMFSGLFAEVSALPMARDLGPLMDEFRPELVLHEMAELVAAPLAESRGVRHVTVGFGGALPDPVRVAALEAAAPLWESVGLQVPDDLGMFAHGYLHPFPPSLGQRPDQPHVHDMRPLNEDGANGPEPGWLAGLGVERPLVYVTFGTEMAPIAPWPAVAEMLRAVDVDAVLTIGGQFDPASIPLGQGSAADRVRIERYVPQSYVIARASVVVSHAGSGTSLAAASAGLPQLMLPLGADQFENARGFVGAGAAVAVLPTEIGGTALTDALERLLTVASFRDRAQHLADEIRAMPHPDDVARMLTGG